MRLCYLLTIAATLLNSCSASLIPRETDSLASQAGLLEKRHNYCNDPCPPNQHRGPSCHCELNSEITIPCKVVCTEKPEFNVPGFTHQPAHVCGQQTLQHYSIVAHNKIYLSTEPGKREKHWDITRCHDPQYPSLDNTHFTGTLEESGHLAMRIGEHPAMGRDYIVGLGVGFYTYYFNLPGFQSCMSDAPEFQDLYQGLNRITVREIPNELTGPNMPSCADSHP